MITKLQQLLQEKEEVSELTINQNQEDVFHDFELDSAENVQLVEDEEALNAGSPIITLLTCYQTAEQGRFVVQAKLTKIYKNDSAPQKIKNYFGLATWKLQ